MTVLAYDPQRLALLATMTRAAADELGLSSQAEPYCEDAATIARGIGGSLEKMLVESLRDLLLSTAMTEWRDVFTPMTVDDLLVRLTAQAPGPAPPFVIDGGQYSLAAAITAGSEAQWQHVVETPLCVGFDGTYEGGGFITDHRGVRYPIVVPRVETGDGRVFTADLAPVAAGEPSVATLGGTDPGWEVIGWASGVDRFQERPALAEGFAGFLAGTTNLVGPLPPNSGLAHINVPSPGGVPSFAAAATIPGRVVAPPTGGTPDPADTSPGAVVDARAGLAVTSVQGGVMAAAMDNQTQRSYQVIFEENVDGRRRARVQTYTLAHDGRGGVSIIPEHVWVGANGQLISETISYGQPFAPDYLGVVSSGHVASFAFSGNEPFRYPVPRAVFP